MNPLDYINRDVTKTSVKKAAYRDWYGDLERCVNIFRAVRKTALMAFNEYKEFKNPEKAMGKTSSEVREYQNRVGSIRENYGLSLKSFYRLKERAMAEGMEENIIAHIQFAIDAAEKDLEQVNILFIALKTLARVKEIREGK